MNLFDRIRAESSLSELDATERIVLVLTTVLGAALRLWYQHDRPYLGDEVGTLIYMRESPAHILSNFGTWLSMNYFILLEKGLAGAFGSSPWVLTALPLAASVCTIPLTVALALQFCSRRAALIAGALAAMNGYLLEFSPVIRSYSLLVALALVSVILFFRWHSRPSAGRAVACASAATVLTLFHLVGVYVWAGLGLLAVASWVARARAGGSAGRILVDVKTLGPALLGAGAVLVLAYARLYSGIRATNAEWTEPPPTSIDYLPHVFSSHFAGGFLGLVAGLFLVLGTWTAIQEKQHLLVLWLLTAAPICLISWQGVAYPHWAYGRFLIFTLPFLLVLVAEGIDVVSRAFAEPRRAWLSWGLALLVLCSWIPAVEARFARKSNMPWTQLARHLEGLPSETVIVATAPRDSLHLQPFSMTSGRKTVALAEFLQADQPPEPGGIEIAYVNSYERIVTEADSTQFGNLQLISYEGDTLRDLVNRLHADLVRTTREQTGAEFEAHYASLAESSAYLGLRNEAQKFRLLKGWSHQYKERAQVKKGEQSSADDLGE